MSKPFYEEGAYVGEIIQQALSETKGGTPQAVLRVKVLGIPEDDGTFTPVDRQYERTIYMPLTPKTIEFQIENLRTAGFTGDKISAFDPSSQEHQDLTGNQVNLWCKIEPAYQGDGEVERWQISKGRQVIENKKPLDAKGLRNLDSLFSKALKATPAPAKGIPKPALVEQHEKTKAGKAEEPYKHDYADQGITDDDIPF